MARSIVIHVGAMKAASTWLQRAARRSGGVTAFGPGDFEPGLGKIWHDQNGRVSPKLAKRLKAQLEDFIARSGGGDVVISNERFLKGETDASIYFETLDLVAGVFADLSEPVCVLALSRAPVDWIPSIYQQFVKSNQYSRPFSQFAKVGNGAVRGPMSFDAIAAIFRRRLGPDRFVWAPSESFRTDSGPALDRIARLTGVRISPDPSLRGDVNPSIDPIEIEAIRTLNRLKDSYVRSARRDPSDVRKARETFDPAIRHFIRFAMERRGEKHPALRRILARALSANEPPSFRVDGGTLAELEALGAETISETVFGPWRERYRSASGVA